MKKSKQSVFLEEMEPEEEGSCDFDPGTDQTRGHRFCTRVPELYSRTCQLL